MDPITTTSFGEYLPDLPQLNNPGATIAKNVIPEATGYLPLRTLTPVSSALNTRCLGAIAVKDDAANSYNYAGTLTKLYVQAAQTMTSVTNAGGDYVTGADEFWGFVKWGDQVIATNYSDPVQVIDLGGTEFADLAGSPPQARHIAVIGQFVVLGFLDEGTVYPTKVRWSGINDETAWTPSAATQSDSQILQSNAPSGGGWIMGISGHGDYGLVMQEYTCWRMTYIGSPAVFQFDEILPSIGTPARNSIVDVGDSTFFLGQDGFYEIVGGANVIPIGANKVDRTFLADVDPNYIKNVIGAADPTQKIIMWIYPDITGVQIPNKCIIYDYVNKKWSHGEFNCEWIYNGLGVGYTLETLDDLSADLDLLEASLDSREYTGGALQLAAFNTDHKKSTFSGTALNACVETAEVQVFKNQVESRRALVNGVRPLVDGVDTTLTVQVGQRNKQNEPITYGSVVSPESGTNIAHFRSNARYHRFRVLTSNDFDHALGVEVYAKPTGRR